MSFFQKIFSIKEEQKGVRLYKVINILGIKIKKRLVSRFDILDKEKYERELTQEEKEYYLGWIFKSRLGYECDFENPKSLNEKIQWLKLNYENPLMTQCADKYMVREYIKEKIGEEYLIPLIGVYDSPDEIDFDSLPEQFVMKVNWGSGQNIIVKDKLKLDIKDAKKKLKEWMKPESNLYYGGFEWCYKNIQPKIIIEQYIEQLNGPVYDYKWFCFKSEAKILYIAVDSYDYSIMGINYYDENFQQLPFSAHYPNSNKKIEKPLYFDLMKEVSQKLSKDFPFVRIDFYDTGRKLYFGEMTFYPGSGFNEFEPVEWDYKFGEMLKLPECDNAPN